MQRLVRNRLVWLDDAAWQGLIARAPDAQAAEIMAQWQALQRPLVVCTQPSGLPPGRMALGLPAPQRWSRRRLALQAPIAGLTRNAAFPALSQVGRPHGWGLPALALDQALTGLGATARVHGSHGWQLITGEAYVHEASDLDLGIEVPHFDAACQACHRLAAAGLPMRLDGELVFPDGTAIAWREFARMLAGQASEVLAKSLQGPRLMPAQACHELGAPARAAAMPAL
jgi:phosphoribosyl-dephospho-CoA transferase